MEILNNIVIDKYLKKLMELSLLSDSSFLLYNNNIETGNIDRAMKFLKIHLFTEFRMHKLFKEYLNE